MINQLNKERLKALILNNEGVKEELENNGFNEENVEYICDFLVDKFNTLLNITIEIENSLHTKIWKAYRQVGCPYGLKDENAFKWFNEQLEKEGD